MKDMKNYLVEVETVNSEIRSVLIGGGYIAQKLAFILHNRGLSCAIISSPKDLDLSASPEFIFLFMDGLELVPEMILNFVESVRTKLIIVTADGAPAEDVVRQCLSKDIDFCSASIYNLYGGGEFGGILDAIFSEVKDGKLYTFKNDQIIVTPLYIDDAVEGLCRIAFSTQTFKKNFLLTGIEEVPLVGFVNRIAAEAGRIFGFILKSEEHRQAYPDIVVRHEKILQRDESCLLLNWQPEVGLSEGIKTALELLKSINNNLRGQIAEVAKEQPEVKKKTTLSL